MTEEIKIRIDNYKDVEKKLKELGAVFDKKIDVKDTYFDKSEEEVLKVTEDDTGDYLVNLKSKNGKFEIEMYKEIKKPELMKKKLKKKFGVKCVLKKKRIFYDWREYKVNFNLIDNVGDFIVIEGENLDREETAEQLQIENPEYITVPFSDL